MEFRRVFDTIPEQFDRYRPHYHPDAFRDMLAYAGISTSASVLELGPGTGQATDPVLDTGCDYHAIELGEHLAAVMQRKYGSRENFHLVCDDFITHDFGTQRFDLIYSAATIQWIPEEIAFTKTYSLLKPGGVLAMLKLHGDYRTPNEALYQRIQQKYAQHYCPAHIYAPGFCYEHAPNFGYTDFHRLEYRSRRILTADEYAAMSGTHCDHLVIPEPHRTQLLEGLRTAVTEAGGQIVFDDTHILYLARKPLA